MLSEACRFCAKCKTGNDEEGKLALFCHLWEDRVCKVFPFDRCELFRKGKYDMLEFIAIKRGGVDG